VLAKEAKCVAEPCDEILDAFEWDIRQLVRTTAEATVTTERPRSKITEAISCILYDKNEYAGVVRPG